jgi:hypothetical protein
MKLEVINRYHPTRGLVEEFIRQKYLGIFYAKISSFPPILLALTDGNIVRAACGIRTEMDGYFSQIYCEDKLLDTIQFNVGENYLKVFEIVNLVSSGPIASMRLVKEINKFFVDRHVTHTVFSASEGLRTFLSLMGLDIVRLQKADKNKIPNPKDWGSYYETNPEVCYCPIPKLNMSILFKNLRKQPHAEFAQVTQ